MQYLGVPYVWGGASPSGFDCSGLVIYAYAQAGRPGLPHYTGSLLGIGTRVRESELAPGDLVFRHAGHVGLYIGGGQMVHAPHTGDVVRVAERRWYEPASTWGPSASRVSERHLGRRRRRRARGPGQDSSYRPRARSSSWCRRVLARGRWPASSTRPSSRGLAVVGDGAVLDVLPGLRASLAHLATLMLCVSDNAATNVLIDRLGFEPIARRRGRPLALPRPASCA